MQGSGPAGGRAVYIETVGCQMNVLDSEMVMAALRGQGYRCAPSLAEADVVLFNTCSVRQHAEDKVYSALGKLRRMKERRPDLVVGVLGCMAQKDQRRIFARAPWVDLIVGPGQLRRTPELIDAVRRGQRRQEALSLGRRGAARERIKRSHETFDPLRDPDMRPTPFQAYLRIQIGCDKFCTYCIVPMTRGPEQCRPPAEILEEARRLVDQGCLEITLLGQTVNSYRWAEGGRTARLADLLYQLHDLDGLRRLKFVTNYPRDMSRELLRAVRELPKCCPYLHVPAQSGSDRVLKRMKRGYTADQYREMIAMIREELPEASVSSDFIVGFPGETEEDFQQTVELVRHCRFKNSFIFKYSERPGAKAAQRFRDDVPDEVKQRRNRELLAVQDAISEAANRRRIGAVVEVLVEGPSKAAARAGEADLPECQLTGRTMCDRIVVFDGPRRWTGRILPVAIRDATAHTLIGEAVERSARPAEAEAASGG